MQRLLERLRELVLAEAGAVVRFELSDGRDAGAVPALLDGAQHALDELDGVEGGVVLGGHLPRVPAVDVHHVEDFREARVGVALVAIARLAHIDHIELEADERVQLVLVEARGHLLLHTRS
eukprot:COSAG01_NODE_7167_length_3322_cov_2.671114_2_plen_121_part_00